MSSIDRRVVQAKFDNKQFEGGIRTSLGSLSRLKDALTMRGATKGIRNIDDAAKRLSFEGISQSLDTITKRFSFMGIVGVTALATISKRATDAGLNILKSLTIAPLGEGLKEYETNLNSIQTILSNTQWENKTLGDVNQALEELNKYSDLTIYNFAEMARNIGTFTAAGVDLDTSVNAIKGIANLAAVSGSNAQQAATAMYQLSQALSTGTIKLMDWNSVVNAGMGGKVFQDAIKETARAHGVAVDSMIEEAGSFRDSLQQGWFSSEILTDTLAKFTGDLTDAQLEAMGYTQEQIEGIKEMATNAVDAATKVKTFTQLIDTLQETAGSGWSKTWQLVFGDFEEAKELFTGVNNVLSAWIDKTSDARNKVLGDWKALGGRTYLIEGLEHMFRALLDVVQPIKEAFKDFFPGITGGQLYQLTIKFRDFFENFKMGVKITKDIKRTFAGFFAIFGILEEIRRPAVKFLLDIISRLSGLGTGFLDTTGNIGDFLVKVRDTLRESGAISEFFEKATDRVMILVDAIRDAGTSIRDFLGFGGTDAGAAASRLGEVAQAGEWTKKAWSGVDTLFSTIGDVITAIGRRIGKTLEGIPQSISDFFAKIDWNVVLEGINTGLFAAFLLLIKRFIDDFGKSGIGASLDEFIEAFVAPLDSVTGVLNEVTKTLGVMQNTLRAATLLQIAAALGIMALALGKLATIDADGLKRALAAMAALITELLASLLAFQAIGGIKGLFRSAVSLVIIAGAVNVLASAMIKLSGLAWDEIARGLTSVAGLLASLILTTQLMSKQAGGMLRSGAALLILSGAIKVLASVAEDLALLPWDAIARGLGGVAGLLVSLGLFTHIAAVNKGGLAQGAGLLLISGAIKVLASAAEDFAAMSWGEITKGLASITAILAAFAVFTQVTSTGGLVGAGVSLVLVSGAMMVLAEATSKFGDMDWATIGRGLAGMAGVLLAVGTALTLMPPSTLVSAGALVVAAVGLLALSRVLEKMGNLSWEVMGKGMVALGGALAILALGLTAMSGTLLGSASLLVAATALTTIVPVLYLLGGLSWEAIAKGAVVLAGAFAILAVAGTALTPTVPTFLGLGAAFVLLGTGAALLGVGIGFISDALVKIARYGEGALVVFGELTKLFIDVLPELATNLAKGFVAFLDALADSSDKMVDFFVQFATMILDAAQDLFPSIMNTFEVFFLELLDTLRKLVPDFSKTALELTLAILTNLKESLPEIMEVFYDLVSSLLDTLREATPQLAASGSAMMVALLVEMRSYIGDIVEAGIDFLVALINGVTANVSKLVDAGADLIVKLIEGIGSNTLKITEAAADTIVTFVNGLADAMREKGPELREAGVNLAKAIVEGMVGGLSDTMGLVTDAAAGLARGVLNKAKSVLGIESPSKEFQEIGEYVGEGFLLGLVSTKSDIINTWQTMAALLKSAMEDAVNDIVALREEMEREANAEVVDLEYLEALQAELDQTTLEYESMAGALDELSKAEAESLDELKELGAEYAKLSNELLAANDALDDAIRTRDEYRSSISDSFDDLPNISEETGLEDYISELDKRNRELAKFIKVMAELRELGLSDQVYEEFMEQGTDALGLAQELAAGGADAVSQVNDLSQDIENRAKTLGRRASEALYQAGVDAAQGVVDGLESRKDELIATMSDIAVAIVNAIRDELDIQSPSKKMAELGGFAAEGLVKGLTNAKRDVGRSAQDLGTEAIRAIKDTMAEAVDAFHMSSDINPKITPILDLSKIQEGASALRSAIPGDGLTVKAAYDRAKMLELLRKDALKPVEPVDIRGDRDPAIVYNQYNQSPKSLSAAEIYRQTRNQLSIIKGALNVT